MSGTEPWAPIGSTSRGAIVTAAGPSMRGALHDLALPTFRGYAQSWDWHLRAHDLGSDGAGGDPGAVRAKWAKIELLREALHEHPFALWLDADVLLLRHNDDIVTHLHPGSFQALVLEQVPAEHRINPNTGVWLLRSCPMAFAFLDAVQAAGVQPGPWADQGAVLSALGWDRGDDQYRWAGPGPGNAFTAATSWLPPSWNQPYLGPRLESDLYNGDASSYVGRPSVPQPHALHFMGMLPTARYRQMKLTLDNQETDPNDTVVPLAASA